MHHLASIFLTLLIFLAGGNLAEGRRTARKDFNGQTIARTYDYTTSELLSIAAPQNHPSLTLSHAPARYDFTYDLLGRRTGSTAKNKLGTLLSSETYQYDLRSQLTGYTGPTGSIGYGYDSAGNLTGTKSSTPGGYDVSYDYDALNRITLVHRGQQGIDPTSTQLAAYNYDANGNLNGTGYANGVQHAYTYNALNRLTNLNVARSVGVSPTSLQSYAYQLNKNGHRTQITELSGRTINNTFDAIHRLTREAITLQSGLDILSQPSPPAGTLSYSYDPVGNRTSRTTTGPVATIIPNQTQSFTVNDRLTTDTYDANGNTTESRSVGVSPTSSSDIYSFDNKLIRRTTHDGKTIDLTYNPDGHRLSKFITQNALTQRLVHYLTDANNPTGYAQVIEEKDPLEAAGSQLKKVNLYGHDLISSLITDHSALITKPIFYQYDGLGSVRSITNSTGDLQETYDYDAYGTLIGLAKRNASTGVLESTLITDHSALLTQSEYLFTGEQFDSDLGMYFLRARYLNTNTGRFHSQDTYEGRNGEPLTLHKYLYANGNPATMVDPSGRFSLSEVTTAISITLSFSNIAVVSAVSLFKGFPDSFSFGVFGSVEIGKGVAALGGAEIEFSPRERKMGVYAFGGPEYAPSVTVGAGPHVKGELGTFEAWTWEAPGAKSHSVGGFLLGAVAAGNIFGGYETTDTGAKIYVVGASWSFPSNSATTLGGFVLGGPTYKLYEREMTEGQMIAAVAAAELANTAAIQTQSGIGFNGASGAALGINPFAAAAWVHMVYGRK